MTSSEGEKFLKQFPSDRILSVEGKQKLVGLITGQYLDKKIKLGQKDISELTKQIVNYFPLEKESSFYDSTTKKGIFLAKANNLLQRYRKEKKIEKPSKRQRIDPEDESSEETTYSQEELNAKAFVQAHFNDELLSFYPTIWKMCYKLRVNDIKLNQNNPMIVLNMYKAFSRPEGSLLVKVKIYLVIV